jgi:hypothetical protein
MPNFEHLFTPVRIGPMTVPNRIVETTYSINSGRADGLPDAPFIVATWARLRRAGVVIHPSTRVWAMDGRTALGRDVHTGREVRFEDVDTLVLSLGMESDDDLHGALVGRVPELFRIGSAFAPRYLAEATQHGASVGRLL